MAKPESKIAGTLARVFRTDGWKNFLTGVNSSTRDKRTASFIAHPQTFMQGDLERFYRGNDLARRICTLPALDMTRKGYELDIDEAESDVKKGISNYLKERGWFKELFQLATFSRLYGRCYALIGVDDGQDMAEPVDFESIRSIKYINVLDPWALRVRDLQRDVMAPNYGKPETFYVNLTPAPGFNAVTSNAQFGQIVHESRVIWLDGSMMTPYQARFSGNNVGSSADLAWCPDSIFVPLYSVIRDYDQSWDSSAILLQDFAQAVYKIKGLGEMMAANGEEQVRSRMAIVDESRSVLRAMLLDAEFEDFERKATPITGLPEMMDRWLQRVAAAAEIPIPLLFGSPTGGLNASDDGAYEGYYNLIAAKQVNDLEPAIRKMTKLAMCAKDNEATKGIEPTTWHVCFEQLWSLSEKEEAELRKVQADTDALYITNQVVTPNEVALSRFGGEKYSTDTTIDVDAHEAHAEQTTEVASAEAAALIAQHNATATPAAPGESSPVSAGEPHERAQVGGSPAPVSSAAAPLPGAPVSPALGAQSAPEGLPVEKSAFNGTQMGQVLAYAVAVGAEEVSRAFAVQALSLLLQLTPEQSDALLADMGAGFKPKPPDPPMMAPGAKPPGKPGAAGKPAPFAKKDDDLDLTNIPCGDADE